MSLLEPSFAGLRIWPLVFEYTMLSTSIALLPVPETHVVTCPPPLAVWNTTSHRL